MSRKKTAPNLAGLDLGSGLLRLAIGATMIAHGLKHAKSLDGTAGWFESIGFRKPKLQAQMSAVVEVGAGAALILGAGTPLAAAAVVGTMGVAAQTVHRENGFFITSEGWEYVGLISAASVAVGALGPGRVSVDRLLGADRLASGPIRAALVAVIGLVGAATQLKIFWKRPLKA